MKKIVKYLPLLIFLFTVLGNLQYPLLWNDEAECIMHSKRVLEYGYPKIHGEKNVVYPIRHTNKTLAINESTDAYTGIGWGMFYFGTIAVKLANITDDIYFKTWLLRFPFLIMGIWGLWILYRALTHFLLTKKEMLILYALLFLLLALHVDFGLHLREARYYGLMVFSTAWVISLLVNLRIKTDKKLRRYLIWQSLALWIMYNVFPPLFIVFAIFLFIYELTSWKVEGNFLKSFMFSLPVIIAGILILPIYLFFDSFEFSTQTAAFYGFNFKVYLSHIKNSALYFINMGYFWWILGMSGIILILFIQKKIIMRKTEFALIGLIVISAIYFMVINYIPHYVFTRYLIPLIVLQVAIFSFEVVILYKHLKTGWFYLFLVLIFSSIVFKNYDSIEGRLYELTHPYKGRLDYEIPFIKKQFPDKKDLVIATNYEECSYMYYLDAKVTMGFVLNNLEEDLNVKPDVIMFRKDWGWNYDRWKFEPLFRKGNYKSHYLEVYDYPYNNLPDLYIKNDGHLFKTKLGTQESNKAKIYVLK